MTNAAKSEDKWVRLIYLQNCLQQDFWINNDPQGNIGGQVHNTCTYGVKSTVGGERKKKKLSRAPWVKERKQMWKFEQL